MNKLISFKHDITTGDPETNFYFQVKGQDKYLVNGDFEKSIQKLFSDAIESVEDFSFFNTIPITKAKNILIYRSGGIGDLLFLFPYLYKLKELNPICHISFSTFSNNVPVLKLCEAIDEIIPEPLPYERVLQHDFILNIAGFIEENPKAEIHNAFDLGKDFLNIPKGPMSSKRKYIRERKPDEKIRIAIAFASSVNIRDVSPKLWIDFCRALDAKKYEVCFLGTPHRKNDIDMTGTAILKINPTLSLTRLTVPDLQEVIDYLLETHPPDIFIGPDSGLTNIAGYHGIPTIGIFGPFPSDLRLRYYKNAVGVDAFSNCPFAKNEDGNCFQHGTGQCKLAEFTESLFSPCLEKITADSIFEAMLLLSE